MVKLWNRFPREVVDVPSLEISKVWGRQDLKQPAVVEDASVHHGSLDQITFKGVFQPYLFFDPKKRKQHIQ